MQVEAVEEPFDSRLELVVLEGGGKGSRHPLDRSRMTLGRLDEGDEPTPGTVAFPDPTVSRVHAQLQWEPKRHRYVLEHRSRTNATVINGTQVVGSQTVEVGDRIKMGGLVVLLQKATQERPRAEESAPASVESERYLVCVRGPAPGTIFPLNYNRLLVGETAPEAAVPGVFVSGAGDAQGVLHWSSGDFVVRPAEAGRPLRVLCHRPGCVSEIVAADPAGVRLSPGSLLVCGSVVLALVPVERAGDMREALLAGADAAEIHPLLPHVDPQAEPCWQGGEEHLLRVLSGIRRGSRLWMRPEELPDAITIGSPPADLEIPDRNAARLSLHFAGSKVEVLNLDAANSFTHNWELVTPGEEIRVVSGDRFTFERTVVAFEHGPLQARVDSLSLFLGEAELPLLRQSNCLGYNPQSDVRIDDRRLAPTHGLLEVRENGLFYRHKAANTVASVGERKAGPGQELELSVGDVLVLLPDIQLRLDRRQMTQKPGDHVLIGPTQEEIEAARARGA